MASSKSLLDGVFVCMLLAPCCPDQNISTFQQQTLYVSVYQPCVTSLTQYFFFSADSTAHLKPRDMTVQERLSNVELTWMRPRCEGEVANYIFVLLGGTTSFDTEIKVGSLPRRQNQPGVAFRYSYVI